MGRMLSVADYGLLVSLSSLLILLGIFGTAFTNIFAKFSAKYKGTGDEQGAKALFSYGFRFLSIFVCGLVIIFLLLIPLFRAFLHVTNTSYLIYIIAAALFSLFLTLPQGFLQGRMQFVFLSLANLSQPVIKIIAAVVLLSLGLGIKAPLAAIVLSLFLPATILFLYFYRRLKKMQVSGSFDHTGFRKQFIHYSYTFFLSGVGIAILSNTDILFVRHFFPEVVSGQYAALSLMGKAIFYLVSPINFAFFPLIAYKRERQERLFGTVILALGIVLLASIVLSFIYFAFPHLVLRIFFPAAGYRVLSQYLGLFSLYIMLFSLATLLNSFFLSVGRTQVYKISLIAALSQIVLILLFHNSLYQIIGSLFFSSLLFFVILLGYYVKYERD